MAIIDLFFSLFWLAVFIGGVILHWQVIVAGLALWVFWAALTHWVLPAVRR